MVGSAVWRRLEAAGFTDLRGAPSSELDLRDRDARLRLPRRDPAALRRAGRGQGRRHPGQQHLPGRVPLRQPADPDQRAWTRPSSSGVERLLFLGSSCIYPRLAPQPIREDSLLTGHLEPTNDAYAIAKIAGILGVQAVRRQYGLPWISAMPTNLYGPGDNFSPTGSHVLPALIRRYDEARAAGVAVASPTGAPGHPRREFLHVDDLADACLHLLEHYDGPEQVNVGTGKDVTIAEIAELVAEVVGYAGETRWDTSKPDGTPQQAARRQPAARRRLDGHDRRCARARRRRSSGTAHHPPTYAADGLGGPLSGGSKPRRRTAFDAGVRGHPQPAPQQGGMRPRRRWDSKPSSRTTRSP